MSSPTQTLNIFNLNSAVLLTLTGALCFGTTGTAQALAPEGSQPLIIGTMRLVVGGLVMLLWNRLALAGKQRNVVQAEAASWPRMTTLLATAGIVIFQICFFGALARTGVAVGTMIAIGFGPVAGGIAGYFMHGERPGMAWYIATALSLAGLGLLSFDGTANYDGIGIMMALVAGAGQAMYVANSKTLLQRHNSSKVIARLFCIGGIAMSPLLFMYDVHWIATPSGFGTVLYLGAVGTALAYTLFAMGLRTLPVSSSLTLGLAEPLVAALLGIILLHEQCTMQTATGMLLLFAGMFVIARDDT